MATHDWLQANLQVIYFLPYNNISLANSLLKVCNTFSSIYVKLMYTGNTAYQ